MTECRILLVDDHKLFTGAMSALLSDMPYVAECMTASSLSAARKVLDSFKPDIALIDVALPDGNGLELLNHLKQMVDDCRVMLVSGNFSPSQLAQLSGLSPDGLFSKSDGPDELQEGIDCLRDGETYVSSEVGAMLRSLGDETKLSPRQLEILYYAQSGLTNKAIASQLGVSASTIAFHLRETRIRLGVRTTREAIKAAQDHGFL